MALQLGPGGAAAPRPPAQHPFASTSVLSSIANAANNLPATYSPNYSGIIGSAPKPPTSVAASVPNPSYTQSASDNPYQSQLSSDPTLQAALAGINAQGTANAGQLTAEQQQALIRYGQIPGNLNGTLTGDVNSDIDQTTRDLAQQATQGGVSTVAQLQKAYQNQQAADNASLAARGMLHSGALGQHANLDLTAYQQSQSDALNQLLSALSGYYQNYLGLQSQGQSAAAAATNQALQRIIASIQAGAGAQAASGNTVDYTPPTNVDYTGPVVTGVPVTAPGAATPNSPGLTVGGYISGGKIRT